MTLLDVHHLSIHIPTDEGSIQAVRDVHFRINKGEIIGIIGESGCGKSVMAQSILRLLPSQCQIYGQIFWQGENLLHKTEKEMQAIRGRQIGMVFQDPMSTLNPTMTIGQQITEGLIKHLQISSLEAYEKSIKILIQVGIADPQKRVRQYPHELSGGIRQRVLIGIALACQPSLLIADEPTTALDVTIQAQILELLKQIQKDSHLAMLFITHDLGVVASLCDRVMVMYAGQIVEEASVDDLFSSPLHPYTQALLQSKQSLYQNRNHDLVALPGFPPNLINPPQGCAFEPRCSCKIDKCTKELPALLTLGKNRQAACWRVRS